jgi:3-hydroxyacyl-CoA dehydrogenase
MSATVRRIAVIGPGLMGLGIAQVAAAAGIEVMLVGRDRASAAAGQVRLVAQLERQVGRGRLGTDAAAAIAALVHPTDNDADLADCDLAIESVPEDRALKETLLRRIEAALPAEAWLATNTSGLPISGLARALRRPEQFLGLHFFSPVERMKLVEVVRGEMSSQATVDAALAFVAGLRQQPIVVRDGPGFFTTRVFAAYLDEALALLGEGVDAAAIEAAALANGRAVGPLAVLDEVSLGLNLQQADQARADGLDERFCRPLATPVLERMVALGRGGRRQGSGFYDHPAGAPKRLWPGLDALFTRAANQPTAATIALRLRSAETLEALLCLEEGMLASADDADTGSLLGLGQPAASGGILRSVEWQGVDRFVLACDDLAATSGVRFRPSPWLRQVAAAGRGFEAWRRPQKLEGEAA